MYLLYDVSLSRTMYILRILTDESRCRLKAGGFEGSSVYDADCLEL